MVFGHLNRRLHLYMALSLAPWFLMYGISSIVFSHNRFFDERDRTSGVPLWNKRFERRYDLAIPAEGSLRPLAKKVMEDHGLSGSYGGYRAAPDRVDFYVYGFWRHTRIQYHISEQRLVAEDRRFRWDHFLTGMHAKGGFQQEGFFHKTWSVIVDLVCLGMLLWIASGIYMWWGLRRLRRWGLAALAGGALSFAWFLSNL
jgi:hypothetical protein